MKNYSVVYLAEAEEELVSIWEASSDRTRVAEAANLADEILATLPQSRSVYLEEKLWRLEIDRFGFISQFERRTDLSK